MANDDKPAIKRISEQVRLQLSISVISDDEPVADWIRSGVRSLPHSPVRLENGKDILTASTIVPDIYGRPFLTVRVDTPRAITARGKSAVLLAIVSIGSAGLLVMGLLLFMLHRTILNPLAGLTAHAVQMGEKGDLLARLTLNRKDEVGVLANAFDQMIDRLSETRSKLLDQSFQSGIAEMASGVLHNIGNAMTPLGVQLVALDEELRGAPRHEMEMAAREFSDPSTPADRRVDLTRFVELAGSEMAGTIGRARDHVAAVGRQVQYVHQILADQDRYSRAARVMEPVCVREVVLRSAETLSPQMRAAMAIEVDCGVKGVGNVFSSRAALDQVVTNLLVNAAESMLEGREQGGRLLISAAREDVDGAPMAHFYFKDNGKGIPEEHLKRVFERSFSTKGRGSGLGLHWSANTVTALNGFLYAEREASSGGACLHLLLPLVVEKNGRSGMEAD